MSLTVMFWNVWYENQLNDEKLTTLKEALTNFIHEYNPDVIGLNEVVRKSVNGQSALNRLMVANGYKYTDFAATNSIKNNNYLIGSAIYSKTRIFNPRKIILGSNNSGKNRKDFVVSAVCGYVKRGGKTIQIIVAHPVNIKHSTILEHYRHTKSLKKFIDSNDVDGLKIIGGDMNEFRFLPFSLRLKLGSKFNHKTGTFVNPTWRLGASHSSLVRANLDRLFWTKSEFIQLYYFKIVDTNISDHRPIIAKFSLN